jgi:DNA polymerase-3 subunit gamma/tau
MSLYRKHRPQKFADIIGQEHIKRVLTNAVMHNKIGHAYLFSGPRGTGKTTMARLLAKALNCKHPSRQKKDDVNRDFEPCNQCSNCVEITGDRSMDVIEIDAASNRGIDEIRDLRDKVRFAPSNSPYKVYIIDEAHMLTKEAFNALLKTLEEPPAHAVFVLATTELHKVPDTILSRTQQLDFKRANISDLVMSLSQISIKEKFDIDPKAIEIIARASDGSFRDAASILDQVASSDDKIDEKMVRNILGWVSFDKVEEFVGYLLSKDAKPAIDLIESIYLQGFDLAQFNQSIIEYIRNKMISDGDYSLIKMVKIFIECSKELKTATIAQIPLELAVLESIGILSDNLIIKSDNVNQTKEPVTKQAIQNDIPKVKNINDDIKVKLDEAVVEKELDIKKEEVVIANKVDANNDEVGTIDLIEFKKKWPQIVGKVEAQNRSFGVLLRECELVDIQGGKIHLNVPFQFYSDQILSKEKNSILIDIIINEVNCKLTINCIVKEKKKDDASQNERSATPLLQDAIELFG